MNINKLNDFAEIIREYQTGGDKAVPYLYMIFCGISLCLMFRHKPTTYNLQPTTYNMNTKKLFGTDGIRGKVNTYPITPEVALQLGKAIASYYGVEEGASVVIGKDTRLSGYMLESALTSGLVSMGMDVFAVGIMPTPGVAHLAQFLGTTCGIMITASHNPYEDNGIKIFDTNGFKLPDKAELDIEKLMFNGEINASHIGPKLLGEVYKIEDANERYIEFAKNSSGNTNLDGLKIVLDCANGAAYQIAPQVFKELGAEIISVGAEPDGLNINKDCGATVPHNISNLVREHKADVGICLDGDADRVIMLDANGAIVNGDRLLAMCAIDYKEQGRLANNTLIVTVMSNLGLMHAMKREGIKVKTTQVGDRYVIEYMRNGGYNIGGEQSGHIVFMDHATTGDGIISALHVLQMMKSKQKTLAELADCIEEFPQILKNIQVKEKRPIEDVPALKTIVEECEKNLGEDGRILVRYSGTENLMRIMVEARTLKVAEEISAKICKIAEKNLI